MCSKSKYFRRIVLAEFRNRELLSRKLKNFVSIRIELARGRNHLRLWIGRRIRFCCSRFFIFQLELKAGSGVACAFEGLDNIYLEAFRQILRQNSAEAE